MDKIKFCDLLDYEQPQKYIVINDQYTENGKYPVLTAGKSFILGYTNEINEVYNNLPVIIFDDFTCDCKYVDFPFVVKSSAMKMLKPKNDNVNLKYCFYYMNYIDFKISEHKRHWISIYSQLDIKKHDLKTQQKIVDELDCLSDIIEKKKQQLADLDNLIKSQFIEMFGDVYAKQNEAKYTIGHYVSDKTIKVNKLNGISDIKYIDISSINNQTNEITSYSCYKINERPSRAQQVVENGDVLISTVRPNLNNVAMVKGSLDNMVASTGFCVLKNNQNYNSYFLFTLVRDQRFADYLSKLTTGASYPAVNNKAILDFRVDFPPIEVQNKFADFVKHIDKLKFELKQSIEETQNLFNERMQHYFGE